MTTKAAARKTRKRKPTVPVKRGRGKPRTRTVDMRTLPRNLNDSGLLARAIAVTTDPETKQPITDKRFAELVALCNPRTLRKYLDDRPLPALLREKLVQHVAAGGKI
jgi:hypothetical protein